MLVIQNLIFFNIIFFIGRGLNIFFELYFTKNKKYEYFGIRKDYFYPLFTFFILGNLSFIINFFAPLQNNFLLIIISIFIVFNFKNKVEDLKSDQLLITNLVIPIILAISSISVGFHYDAPLYHLNTQNWIINEKIVLGISNVYLPLGFASINEYILANFWIQNNFVFQHFVNLSFLNTLFSFIYFFIFKSKSIFYRNVGIFTIFYGFLDNFGINGGRNGFFNIQGIGKVDNNFAVIFFLTSIFLIKLIKKENFESSNLFIISNFVLFSIQLKVYGYGLSVLYIYYLYLFLRNTKVSILKVSAVRPSLILGALWLFKDFLKTSCLIYPVEFTCFKKMVWYSSRTPMLSVETREFHNALTLNDGLPTWFESFSSKQVDFSIFMNFVISYIFLFFISRLFFNKTKVNRNLKILITLFIFFNLILFLITAPTPRFLIGLLVFIVSSNALFIKDYKVKINSKFTTYSLSILFLITIGLIPRISDYQNTMLDPLLARTLTPKQIEYIDNTGWGVKPLDGEQCWINLECTESDSFLQVSKPWSYMMFSSDE